MKVANTVKLDSKMTDEQIRAALMTAIFIFRDEVDNGDSETWRGECREHLYVLKQLVAGLRTPIPERSPVLRSNFVTIHQSRPRYARRNARREARERDARIQKGI